MSLQASSSKEVGDEQCCWCHFETEYVCISREEIRFYQSGISNKKQASQCWGQKTTYKISIQCCRANFFFFFFFCSENWKKIERKLSRNNLCQIFTNEWLLGKKTKAGVFYYPTLQNALRNMRKLLTIPIKTEKIHGKSQWTDALKQSAGIDHNC